MLAFLARQSLAGKLGLFVGTGFSIAATDNKAPTFKELLVEVNRRLALAADFAKDRDIVFRSFPQIASSLLARAVERGAHDNPPVPEDAIDLHFRQTICDICALRPAPHLRPAFRAALTCIRPSWVVTTNYDHIVEELLPQVESLVGGDRLHANADRVPVYHLHGHRRIPSSLKVTEEDYVGMLSPWDYPRLKLPLLFYESTPLMLGYSLGDINVRTAVQWANSFPLGGQPSSPIVQALFAGENAEEAPYEGADGELVLEISSIRDFLEELCRAVRATSEQQRALRAELEQFSANEDAVWNLDTRADLQVQFRGLWNRSLELLGEDAAAAFAAGVLDSLWSRAIQPGAFVWYSSYLRVWFVLARATPSRPSSRILITFLLESLKRVAYYIHKEELAGYAWGASVIWFKEWRSLPSWLFEEIVQNTRLESGRGFQNLLADWDGPA